MALANLMRLSLMKSAHVAVGWVRAVGDPGFARDDKSEGGASIVIVVTWDGQSGSTDVHSSPYSPP
jgi:hypothetical protein